MDYGERVEGTNESSTICKFVSTFAKYASPRTLPKCGHFAFSLIEEGLTEYRFQVAQPGRGIFLAVLDFGRRLLQIDVGLFGKHFALFFFTLSPSIFRWGFRPDQFPKKLPTLLAGIPKIDLKLEGLPYIFEEH